MDIVDIVDIVDIDQRNILEIDLTQERLSCPRAERALSLVEVHRANKAQRADHG